ncbi:unnamed protein product, partial [Polarella glacialis]
MAGPPQTACGLTPTRCCPPRAQRRLRRPPLVVAALCALAWQVEALALRSSLATEQPLGFVPWSGFIGNDKNNNNKNNNNNNNQIHKNNNKNNNNKNNNNNNNNNKRPAATPILSLSPSRPAAAASRCRPGRLLRSIARAAEDGDDSNGGSTKPPTPTEKYLKDPLVQFGFLAAA